MLRGAAWCCGVLRGAAWCCGVLRGAAGCNSLSAAGCCGVQLSLCCGVLRGATLSLLRGAAGCCGVSELQSRTLPNLPNSWLPRPALCVWAFAAHRKSLPLTGNWQHGLARVCLLHAAPCFGVPCACRNPFLRCSQQVLKCPPAEQINAHGFGSGLTCYGKASSNVRQPSK
jgi:hypothetical protein